MTPSDAGSLALRTWPGAEPGVLIVHASGFSKELWGPVVDALGNEPVAATAFDQRGHGESPPMGVPMDWSQLGADVAAVVASIDPPPTIGVGHSSGGAAIAIAAIEDAQVFDHLVLIEPIITPPPHERHDGYPMAAVAERRRSTFPDRETARGYLADKRAFARWVPAAFDAYLSGGLRDTADGVVLRCTPETEAEHYRSGWAHPTWDRLGEITCPVTLISGAESTTHHGEYLSDLTARFKDVELVVVPGATHFVPMEHPELVADAILNAREPG